MLEQAHPYLEPVLVCQALLNLSPHLEDLEPIPHHLVCLVLSPLFLEPQLGSQAPLSSIKDPVSLALVCKTLNLNTLEFVLPMFGC